MMTRMGSNRMDDHEQTVQYKNMLDRWHSLMKKLYEMLKNDEEIWINTRSISFFYQTRFFRLNFFFLEFVDPSSSSSWFFFRSNWFFFSRVCRYLLRQVLDVFPSNSILFFSSLLMSSSSSSWFLFRSNLILFSWVCRYLFRPALDVFRSGLSIFFCYIHLFINKSFISQNLYEYRMQGRNEQFETRDAQFLRSDFLYSNILDQCNNVYDHTAVFSHLLT